MRATFLPVVFLLGMILAGCTKDSGTQPDPGRAAFIGDWTVTSSLKLTYDVTISEDPNSSTGVFIHNFADIGWSYAPAGAAIKGSKIVLDANQTIGDGLTISGSGTYSSSRISWSYTIFDGADMVTVTEIYTRP
ncbi:MAG TPA: hypothetical protein PLK82_06615 [Bacteroidales bacterium]|nr:hypothetical protein [Bacteroidales bacterium]